MIKQLVPAALLFAMVAVSSGGAKAASPPESGTYSFLVENGSISGPAGCRNNELFSYIAGATFLFWPGLSAPGAVLRKVEGSNLRITTLPATPAASAVWQGQFTTHTFPNDSKPNTGKWSATLTFVDASSFLLHYTLNAGNCTLTNDTILIRTGS